MTPGKRNKKAIGWDEEQKTSYGTFLQTRLASQFRFCALKDLPGECFAHAH
jgi:hypothetical protein